jgi:regulator of protease activity HflC (stomatin/prohibitin superfamily)
MQLRPAMVIFTGIVLATVAIALGHVSTGVRVVRLTGRGVIERFGEYGASRSWVSRVQ